MFIVPCESDPLQFNHKQYQLQWQWFDFNDPIRNNQALVFEGGAVAQSAERATPGEGVLGLIPIVTTRSLLVGSVSV